MKRVLLETTNLPKVPICRYVKTLPITCANLLANDTADLNSAT